MDSFYASNSKERERREREERERERETERERERERDRDRGGERVKFYFSERKRSRPVFRKSLKEDFFQNLPSHQGFWLEAVKISS